MSNEIRKELERRLSDERMPLETYKGTIRNPIIRSLSDEVRNRPNGTGMGSYLDDTTWHQKRRSSTPTENYTK